MKSTMNKQILLIGVMICSFSTFAQNAQDILKRSYNKCQSVKSGSYDMTKWMKFMSGPDTSKSSFTGTFKKLEDDTLFSSAFHYQRFWKNEYTGDVIYTGDDLVTTSLIDSTATITSKIQWADHIKAIRHNYTFYSPLTNKGSAPLLHDSEFVSPRKSFQFIGEEKVGRYSCYHVQVISIPDQDSTEMMNPIGVEYHYWINKEDYIPVQYSTAIDLVMNHDTMHQFESDILNHYVIDHLPNDEYLTLNSIPSGYKIKDYVPYNRPELLKKDTLAPEWELPSLTDEMVSLDDLRGKLVLIDFFYKSCYPCMQALPALQALHMKYKDQGLIIVGIDPYDKKEDDIAAFLAKRGVSYTVLLEGKDVAKEYRVSGYPTIFLIDKTGKIIFTQVGYGKGTEETLEEVIRENL
jgi:thiol-disulfide isomerase/thioredoxin